MRPYPIGTMKAILTLVSLATLFLTGCVSGGSYTSYSTGRSYSAYASTGYVYPTRPYWQQQRTFFVGPQYYKTYDSRCGNVQYRNYSSAPVNVVRPDRSVITVPRSWN